MSQPTKAPAKKTGNAVAKAGPIGQALEQAKVPGPRALVAQYESRFADALPSHLRTEQWIRLAQGALRKGKYLPDKGCYQLEAAAQNNPGVFLATLLDAASKGLVPGTEEYYLTPRRVKVGNEWREEILGITGWQGYVELMYRAGAVASVVAEIVYAEDRFTFRPGVDDMPLHDIDWDKDDRGDMRLVYAFAKMKDGAVSRVIVLNAKHIAKVKGESKGSDQESSPWQKWPESMWLKTAVRQLRKWVPTSAEWLTQGGGIAAGVALAARTPPPALPPSPAPAAGELGAGPEIDIPDLDPDTGEVVGAHVDDDVLDLPAADDDPGHGTPPATGGDMPPRPAPPGEGYTPRTDAQSRKLHALLKSKLGVSGDARFEALAFWLDRPITSSNDVSVEECNWLITVLEAETDLPAQGEQQGLIP